MREAAELRANAGPQYAVARRVLDVAVPYVVSKFALDLCNEGGRKGCRELPSHWCSPRRVKKIVWKGVSCVRCRNFFSLIPLNYSHLFFKNNDSFECGLSNIFSKLRTCLINQ